MGTRTVDVPAPGDKGVGVGVCRERRARQPEDPQQTCRSISATRQNDPRRQSLT